MTRPHKILMLTTQLGYGGAETSFIRLANFLAQSMEVSVALFTKDYGRNQYAAGHATLHAPVMVLDAPDATSRVRRWLHRLLTVRRLKQQHDVTISFLSGPNLINVLAGRNSTTVVSLRGSRRYDPLSSGWRHRIFQYLLDPFIFRLAARIVPVSAGLKNEIRQVCGEKPLAKVAVIPPFIENAELQPRLTEASPEFYGPLKGQQVIVSVGRLSVEKGFHHLIRVFADLARSRPGVKLLLVGDGPMLTTLRLLCVELNLAMDDPTPGNTSVLFAGYQKNVLPLMALGRVCAMPSATEGFPNVLLEAMAARLHVLAADTPWGARAILGDGGESGPEPYPTTQATVTDHGVLMPRIDAPEYHAIWVQTLAAYLDAPPPANPKTAQLLRNYDIATIGAQWSALIRELASV